VLVAVGFTTMHTVLIGGGTGLVGTRLSQLLHERGDEVRILSRSPRDISDYPAFAWDAEAMTIDSAALEGVTHVVNLAGAGIADARWTTERKRLIIDSRTQTTALLSTAIREHGEGIRAYISASAIGYYGNSGEKWVSESSNAGQGFLSESTQAWEAAVSALAGNTGVRTCMVRTGIALSPEGGALAEMLKPTRLGVSGYFGSGHQWYSWIHLDDICRVYMSAIDDEAYEGPLNAVASVPVRNKALAKALASALPHAALVMPVPAFGLKLAFGEMSHTILDSCRVSSTRLVDTLGFDFEWPEISAALRDLLT